MHAHHTGNRGRRPSSREGAGPAAKEDRGAGPPSREFWPADISLLDSGRIDPARVLGPKQVTDLYLLALAVRRDGCFATFDASVPLSAVPGAEPEHLAVI